MKNRLPERLSHTLTTIRLAMNVVTDSKKVQLIARLARISVQKITPLGQGATSAAWHVTTLKDAFIIRLMPAGTKRPVTYQSEFTILRMLRREGCPVPEPVMSSVEQAIPLNDISEPWAITRVVPGVAMRDNPLAPELAHELGRFLAIVHSLPVTGFGRLIEKPAGLTGQQPDPLTGVRARWCWADLWPFDGSKFEQHPFSLISPHIQSKMQMVKEAIIDSIVDKPVALTHSDLHGEHIFETEGSLSGIIDFGAAFLGAPAWDFAVIAFYHGWPAVQATLSGYESPLNKEQLLLQVQLLALVVGLYKLSKAVKIRAPKTKVARIVQFLSGVLEEVR